MIGTLKEQRQMLKELWVSRKGQLEQRFQFNVFKQDTEKVSAFIIFYLGANISRFIRIYTIS